MVILEFKQILENIKRSKDDESFDITENWREEFLKSVSKELAELFEKQIKKFHESMQEAIHSSIEKHFSDLEKSLEKIFKDLHKKE
jgi:uncharacterized protein with HEPN domain